MKHIGDTIITDLSPQPALFHRRIDGATILVSRTCRVTDETYRLTIDTKDFDRWKNGELIQNVWPTLSADHREIMQSGYTPAEWDKLFPSEEG